MKSLFSQARKSTAQSAPDLISNQPIAVFNSDTVVRIATAFSRYGLKDCVIDKNFLAKSISNEYEVKEFLVNQKNIDSLAQRSVSALSPGNRVSSRNMSPV